MYAITEILVSSAIFASVTIALKPHREVLICLSFAITHGNQNFLNSANPSKVYNHFLN